MFDSDLDNELRTSLLEDTLFLPRKRPKPQEMAEFFYTTTEGIQQQKMDKSAQNPEAILQLPLQDPTNQRHCIWPLATTPINSRRENKGFPLVGTAQPSATKKADNSRDGL